MTTTRRALTGAALVAALLLAGCGGGGDDDEGAASGPSGSGTPAEIATDGPCALVDAGELAAAGFTKPLVSTKVDPASLDYDGVTFPACEMEFEEGMSAVVVTLQVIPAEAEPALTADIAGSVRELEGVGDGAVLIREEDAFEPGEVDLKVEVLVDGSLFQMDVPEDLADEDALVEAARAMAARAG